MQIVLPKNVNNLYIDLSGIVRTCRRISKYSTQFPSNRTVILSAERRGYHLFFNPENLKCVISSPLDGEDIAGLNV